MYRRFKKSKIQVIYKTAKPLIWAKKAPKKKLQKF